MVAVVADRPVAAAHPEPVALLAERALAVTTSSRRVLLLTVAALLPPVAPEVVAVHPAPVRPRAVAREAEVAARLLVQGRVALEILRRR